MRFQIKIESGREPLEKYKTFMSILGISLILSDSSHEYPYRVFGDSREYDGGNDTEISSFDPLKDLLFLIDYANTRRDKCS